MGFKENVEALLSRTHWSQRKLAAVAGISSGRVSQILANPTSPTLATVTRISVSTSQTWYATRSFLLPVTSSRWPCVTRETSAPRIFRQSMHSSRMSTEYVQRGTDMAGETVLTPRRLRGWRVISCDCTVCP